VGVILRNDLTISVKETIRSGDLKMRTCIAPVSSATASEEFLSLNLRGVRKRAGRTAKIIRRERALGVLSQPQNVR